MSLDDVTLKLYLSDELLIKQLPREYLKWKFILDKHQLRVQGMIDYCLFAHVERAPLDKDEFTPEQIEVLSPPENEVYTAYQELVQAIKHKFGLEACIGGCFDDTEVAYISDGTPETSNGKLQKLNDEEFWWAAEFGNSKIIDEYNIPVVIGKY